MKALLKKYPYTSSDIQTATGLGTASFYAWKHRMKDQLAAVKNGSIQNPAGGPSKLYSEAYMRQVRALRSTVRSQKSPARTARAAKVGKRLAKIEESVKRPYTKGTTMTVRVPAGTEKVFARIFKGFGLTLK